MSMITRRTILEWIATAAGGAIAGPKALVNDAGGLVATPPPLGSRAALELLPSKWLFDDQTGDFWPTEDLYRWIDDHAHGERFERAWQGLDEADDPDRRLRLVLRRCSFQTVEIELPPAGAPAAELSGGDAPTAAEVSPARAIITVQHWSTQHGDVRPLFKALGLPRPGNVVRRINRKKGTVSTVDATEYLYGLPPAAGLDLAVLEAKWSRRPAGGPPDWSVATTRVWRDSWPQRLAYGTPWAALEHAWSRVTPLECPNCDEPTILTGYGWQWAGMFRHVGVREYTCLTCRKRFDEPEADMKAWIAATIAPKFRPRLPGDRATDRHRAT